MRGHLVLSGFERGCGEERISGGKRAEEAVERMDVGCRPKGNVSASTNDWGRTFTIPKSSRQFRAVGELSLKC